MKKIVLDTSVILKWYIKEKGSLKAKQIFQNLQNKKIQIILPELVKYELGNALLKGKRLDFLKIKKSLKNFYKLPLIFIPEDIKLAFSSYQIAQKLDITYYDASFLSLTKQEKATLITANPKHQKKITGIKIQTL